MAYTPKPGFGNLFKNTRKEGNQPDMRGDVMLTCPHCSHDNQYELAAWKKDGSRGSFLSLKGQPPRNRDQQAGGGDEPF